MMIFQLKRISPFTEQLPQRDLKLFIPTETGSIPTIFAYLSVFCFNLVSACVLYHATRALQTFSGFFDPSGNVAVKYQRKALKGSGTFRVRLVRVFAENRSFTLTVSYNEEESFFLKMITDRVISSLRVNIIK